MTVTDSHPVCGRLERLRRLLPAPITLLWVLVIILVCLRLTSRRPSTWDPYTSEEQRAGLHRVIDELHLTDVTFHQAIDSLAREARMRIEVDPELLSALPPPATQRSDPPRIDAARRASFRVARVPADLALRLILSRFTREDGGHTAFRASGGIVHIMGVHRRDAARVTAVYEVGDLIARAVESDRRLGWVHWRPPGYYVPKGAAPPPFNPVPTAREIEEMLQWDLSGAIQMIMYPLFWPDSEDGQDGSYEWAGGRLIVTHTPEAHRLIELLLHLLRSDAGEVARVEHEYFHPDYDHWTPATPIITRPLPAGLDRRVPSLDLRRATLEESLNVLASRSGATIAADWGALERTGISRTALVHANLPPGTLADALKTALDTLPSVNDGTVPQFYTQRGVIVVSAGHWYQRPVVLRVYDVRDLIAEGRAFADELRAGIGAAPGLYDPHNRFTDLVYDVASPRMHERYMTVAYWAGRLIVYHDPAGHDRVEAMLQALRTRP